MDHSTLAVIVVLALVLLGAWLESWWRGLRTRAAARAAVKRGLKGERDAEKLLKKLGYTVLAKHAPTSLSVMIDGELSSYPLTADFLLEQGGKRIVAEVKTGKAIRLDNAETRRQMLEYQLAFGVDSLLLVDMETRTTHTVRFPLPRAQPSAAAIVKRRTLRWAAVAVVASCLAWFATSLFERSHAPSNVHTTQ